MATMSATSKPLDLWELQPLVIEHKSTVDSALELAHIETVWVQVMNDRYNQRNGKAPPVPELVVMIEHWALQLTRTQDLKGRGLFPDDALYGFFMEAFALNKSNAENVKAAAEVNVEKQHALKLAQQEVERTQHVLKWTQSNTEYNIARLEQHAAETEAMAAFWEHLAIPEETN
tara:strand:- start:66 stop:587 length:522 start_codon:yes stop_codon:yes gene_type:complete